MKYDESVLKDIVLALVDDEQMLRRYIKQLEEMDLGVLPLYTILVDIGNIKSYLEKTAENLPSHMVCEEHRRKQ